MGSSLPTKKAQDACEREKNNLGYEDKAKWLKALA